MKLAWKPVLKIWIKIILLGYAICGQPIGMTAIMMFIRIRIGMMAMEIFIRIWIGMMAMEIEAA